MTTTTTDHCLFLRSEAETDRLGQWLAPLLPSGDTLLLWGEIGAGKSALARSIIRAICGESHAGAYPAMGALTVLVPVAGLLLCLGLFAIGL